MIRRAAVAVCVLAFIGCGTDSAPTAKQSSAPPDTTTTTTAPTTTSTIPLQPAASPQDAATTFVNAWRSGDVEAALAIARPAAVEAVFSAGDPGSFENRGCSHPPVDGPVRCVYKTAIGELVVVALPEPDGWIVDQAILSAA
jgi:hypothetical protein